MIAVTGSGGQLGREIVAAARQKGWEVKAFGHGELDVGDPAAIRTALRPANPRFIVNCAAYTDVDGCEADREEAERINRNGPRQLALLATDIGATLIHFSTDFIFDGTSDRPYTELDAPNPLSHYGRTKLEGELAVRTVAPLHLVIRTSWVYGQGRRNFVTAIASQALDGKPLRVVEDQIGAPTYARDLAGATLALLDCGARGVVNFSNAGECSRYEYAVEITRLLGSTGSINVTPTSSTELARPAARPRYSVLDCGLYRRLTGLDPRAWQCALLAYMCEEFPERFPRS